MGKRESFEAKMARLNEIAKQLESGELSLEESLEMFEEGIMLSKECQEHLNLADMKVRKIVERAGKLSTEDIAMK